ncbi:MAG TPA: LysM domain-containing protein [Polyangiaceae bacterium]
MTGARVLRIGGVVVALTAGALFLTAPAWARAVSASHAPAKSYVVKQGDSGWFQVAKAHGTTMPRLLAANHANAGTPLHAGQRINLPVDGKATPAAKTARSSKGKAAAPKH